MDEARDTPAVPEPPAPARAPAHTLPPPSAAFGWAPVGERLLREFSQTHAAAESAPTVRYAKTWREIKALPIVPQLVTMAVQQMVLLHAVDTMPRGGLCQGSALKESLRRYERLWLPLVAQQHEAAGRGAQQQGGIAHLVPPLDIALLWHLHRLQPQAYAADCAEVRTASGRRAPVLHVQPQQAFAFSDGASASGGAATAALWHAAHPKEPFWPPAAPGSQTGSFHSRLSADLAAVAVRVPVFTHQLLRAAYVSGPFLHRAVDRYCKFLLLRKHHLELQHPIPPLDVALMWACHMSASGHYAADCQQLLQRPFLDLPGAGASLWLERDATGPWRFHWTDTQRAWLDEFDGAPFVVPASGFVPLSSPHPAEGAFSPAVLASFEQGASQAQQPWRAGAHALYLSWLRNPNLRLQQQYEEQRALYEAAHAKHEAAGAALPPLSTPAPAAVVRQQQQEARPQKKGSLFACFGCGGVDADEEAALAAAQKQQQYQQQQLLQEQQARAIAAPVPPHPPALVPLLIEEQLQGLAAGFADYRNLPLTSTHPYWLQLLPRGPAVAPDIPSEVGAEVEVFAQLLGSSSKGGGAANGGGRHSYDRLAPAGDQDFGTSGDYEVEVAGGQPLLWAQDM